MNNQLKDLAKTSLYALGYYHARRALRAPEEARLLVLMYHDILDGARAADPQELDDESPSDREFEAHLRVITKHYRVLPLRQAVERLHRGDLKNDSVALTFDDGYDSVYSVAFPLLKRYDVPATVFLLTDWIDNRAPYWWPRLRSVIQRSDFEGITLTQVEDAVGARCRDCGGEFGGVAGKRLLARAIERHFRELSDEEREPRMSALERLLFPAVADPSPPPRALTWDQVREMSRSGVDFEPHTRTHINIRNEPRERISREIAESRGAVEKETRRKTAGFAYPYGKDLETYTAIEGLLEEQGFAYAITAANGVNSRSTHRFLLERESLPKTTSAALLHRSLMLAFARAREKRTAT
jgi:peptidoglycan/xylan/chitin deacetylase (PgdA/CDA1 family)